MLIIAESEMNELEEILSEISAQEERMSAKASRLKADIEAFERERLELDKTKASYEQLLAFRNSFSGAKPLIGNTSIVNGPRYNNLVLPRAVEVAVAEVAKQKQIFTSSDVADHFASIPEPWRPEFDVKRNRANISAMMSRLVDDGKIELIEPASGRRPGTFKLRAMGSGIQLHNP